MRKVTRTPYGLQVQTALYLGRPHEIMEYSSINELMNDSSVVPYQPSSPLAGMEMAEAYDFALDSQELRLRVLCIGHGAHYNVNGATGGVPYTDYYSHEATNSGMFKMIPFVVKEINSDLSVQQRAGYRLRKVIDINGVFYAAYYGRVLDFENVVAETTYTSVINGVETTVPFIPTINNLKPTPQTVTGANDGSYISVIAPLQIKFTREEITWFKEACELLYGSANYAIISEFAYCTAVDKPITRRYNTAGVMSPVTDGILKESIGVQISVHVTDHVPLSGEDDEYILATDVGATEPLMGVRV